MQPTKEEILAFANAYGMLTHGETEVLTPYYSHTEQEDKPWKHSNVFGSYRHKGRAYGGVFGESLRSWRKEIQGYEMDRASLGMAEKWGHKLAAEGYTLA